MWVKMSLPPQSGAMKPKPFVVLTHFTVPVALIRVSLWPSASNIRQIGLDKSGHLIGPRSGILAGTVGANLNSAPVRLISGLKTQAEFL